MVKIKEQLLWTSMKIKNDKLKVLKTEIAKFIKELIALAVVE